MRAIQDEAKALAEGDDNWELSAETQKKAAVLYSDKVVAWGLASEAAAKLKPISL